MIVSTYTFFFANSGRYFIYNTLSNALVEIDKSVYSILKRAKHGESLTENIFADKELFKMLCNKRFICESNKDELLFYRSSIQAVREQHEFMHLTVAPTMDCCFKCFYCFEKNKIRDYMSEEVMDSIVKFVSLHKDLRRIHLTWFGGEPLMAQEQMRSFYQKLRSQFEGAIESNVITTGFHITQETLSLFKDLNVSSIQVTLDGNRETHNRIKHLDGCDDVFSRVIDNIKLVSDNLPNISIGFRINLTKLNAEEFPDIVRFILNVFPNKNISISPGLVKQMDRENNSLESSRRVYFSHSEFAAYMFSLFNQHGIYTPFIRYPGNELCECAIRDKMAISFDPNGYSYKCWERIGNQKYAIGQLQNDGTLINVNFKELNRELYGADPLSTPSCMKCRYLPICNGGCPIDRIKNEFEGEKNDTCTLYKVNLKKFLLCHLKMKETGILNQ